MKENSLYPKDWSNVAKKDWRRMDIMLKEKDAEAAGYFLQQSLEKYLKAFLLKKGWKLKKIHELDALLDDAVKFIPELSSFYSLCERVSGYYFTERYPSLTKEGLTCEDIQNDIREAEYFLKSLFAESNK
jgi:HEPN domain-containing protein